MVFYSQLGREQGHFSFQEVVSTLVEKLLSRHPHVFPDGTLHSRRDSSAEPDEEGVRQTWESLKKAERGARGRHSVLDDIPIGMPALVRAQKIQKRAAGVGFDWPDVGGAVDKISEEAVELKAAMASGNRDHIAGEVGDLLFSCINLSRHLGVESEGALRNTTRKFEQRFQYIEQCAREQGRAVDSLSLQEMDELWEQGPSACK